jgi:hypothetical protein
MKNPGIARTHENAAGAHLAETRFTHPAGEPRPRRQTASALSLALLVILCLGQFLVLRSAQGQTTYSYVGNKFNLFSCGPGQSGGVIDCSNPAAGETTYTKSDYVFASLTLTSPLAPNLNLQDVTSMPGFLLTMQDGQQSLSSANPGMSVVAEISTDANGNVIAPWWVQIYVISNSLDAGVSTTNSPANGVGDIGDTSLTATGGDLGAIFESPGVWFQARGGTATWFYLEGDAYGIPFGPYEQITGGDNVPVSTQWNFEIPSGWTYGHGQLSNGPYQLSAGAYAATSGPCIGGMNCNTAIGAARGLAYETFTNTGPATSVVMNTALEGGFINSSGGVANAALYVVDASTFANSVPGGTAAAQYLLGNTSIADFDQATPTLSLGGLFPEVLATSTTTEQATAGSSISVPVVTQLFPVAAGENITIIFDVAAFAPVGTIGGGPGTVNFASTLAPAPVFFTDANGNPVTQIVPIGPPVTQPPAPATLTLTPSTTSAAVGTPASVTVTATDSNGLPVPNATVFFSVPSGPNSPLTGPEFTNANGQATLTYSGGGAAGTDSIQASAGSVVSNTASVNWTTPGPLDHITISPASATITSGGSQSYDVKAFDKFGNLISDVTGSTSLSISPDGSCTGATCTAGNPGPHTVVAAYNGDTAQSSLTVSAQSQTITFTGLPATATYGSAGPYVLDATASSSLPVSYSVSGPASISGSTLTVTGAGTVSVTASQAGNTQYSAASPVTLTIVVGKASQTITFNTIPAQNAGISLTLTASASSGLAVSYSSSTSTVCSVSGSTASLLTGGTCTIVASQAGNANYAAASPVTQTFTVQSAASASFTITPVPASETINRGVLGAFLLELRSVNGFNSNVTLSCAGGPSKSVCVDFPQTVKVNGVALAVTGILFPANSTAGTYKITFTGVSGSQTVTTTASFTVK